MVGMDVQLLDRLEALALNSETPVAEMSMEEIATGLGMTRMTLYRKAGTRDDIVMALAARGIDARRQPDVYERVVEATARLLRAMPIAGLTLEQIAEEAACSLPAIYARFGNRQGVLKAVVDRHSPLVPMKAVIASNLEEETPDLRHDVRLLYATLFTQLEREWLVMRSFIAELLRDPDSEVGLAVRDWYVPQVESALIPLIQKHMTHGTMRELPVPLVVVELAAPMGVHMAMRGFIREKYGMGLPDPESTIDLFTDMFCRAVGTESSDAGGSS
jgi:AcrR family transcriptional regulator